jgi:hypothetical protein
MTSTEKVGSGIDPNFRGFAFGLIGHPEGPYVNNIRLFHGLALSTMEQF